MGAKMMMTTILIILAGTAIGFVAGFITATLLTVNGRAELLDHDGER